MDSLNHDNQADVIEAFNSTSRYLDAMDLLLLKFMINAMTLIFDRVNFPFLRMVTYLAVLLMVYRFRFL